MISPNFGEGSFENQPPTFNEPEGKFVQDPNSGGLIVPEGYARDKAAKLQADQQANQADDSEGGVSESLPFDSDSVSEAANGGGVAETTAERAEDVAEAMTELTGTGVTEAESEEEAAEMMKKVATDAGANPEEAESRAKKLMARAAAIAGMTFNEFKQANEGSNLKTFLDAFLVFGTEGRFGDTSASSLKESLGKDTDDAYLNEVLEKGGEKTLLKFFQEVLEKPNLQDLNETKDLIKEFNIKAELNWDDVSSKMADFLNNAKGQYKERSFAKMKALFSRLEGMSQENILKYFNIDLTKEKAEAETSAVSAEKPPETVPSVVPRPATEQQEAA